MIALNLGGEGEVPGVINVFLICPNHPLPFADGTIDVIFTNGVPIDRVSTYGLGVQSAEIQRILKPGGQWLDDGARTWNKP